MQHNTPEQEKASTIEVQEKGLWKGLEVETCWNLPGMDRTVDRVWSRCRANMTHIRQPMPNSGLGFQGKILETFQVAPVLLGRGQDLLESTRNGEDSVGRMLLGNCGAPKPV